MGALTQEERESVMLELDNEEWQQPTPTMTETIQQGVIRSERGIAVDIGERGEDKATTKPRAVRGDHKRRGVKETATQSTVRRIENPGKKKDTKEEKYKDTEAHTNIRDNR